MTRWRARAARQAAAGAGPGGGPRRDRSSPGGRRISPALRRLVVTPTFAAGLGVVVAAFLAANMSRTVLHFSAPIPGNQCSAGDCHAQQPHGGTLASARPGVHITPSVPAASGPVTAIQPGGSQPGGSQPSGSQSGGNQPGGSQSGGSQPSGGGQGGAAPAAGGNGGPQPSVGSQAFSITYQQVEQWPGGFADQITIRGLSGTRAQTWSLAFGYPGSAHRGCPGRALGPGRARGRGGAGRVVARLGADGTAQRPRYGSRSSWRASPPRRQAAPSTASSARSVGARRRDRGRSGSCCWPVSGWRGDRPRPARPPLVTRRAGGRPVALGKISRVTGPGDRGSRPSRAGAGGRASG